MPQFAFDAGNHVAAPSTRTPLPKGMYEVAVIQSDIKTTQAGDGQYIELTLQVLDGEHAGRRIWDRLNVSNPNKQAEDIAKRQLQLLCLAAGVTNLTDTEQLHDRPVLAELDLDRKDATRNRVMGYASTSAKQAARPSPASTAPSPAAKPAAAARPWEKR